MTHSLFCHGTSTQPSSVQGSWAFTDVMPLLRHLRAVFSLAAQANDEPPPLRGSNLVDGEPSPGGAQQQEQQQQREEQPSVSTVPSDPAEVQQAAAVPAGGVPVQPAASAAALCAAVEAVAEQVAAEAGGPDERLQAMQAAQELIEQYMQFADRIHEGE